jgi:hypothetical protein
MSGERDFFQGVSSVAFIIPGQNSTLSSSLNKSRVADSTQRGTSTLSAALPPSLITPTPFQIQAVVVH